jgi:TRAP-type C4-dicarboxylate transport system permease small subunit
VSEGSLNLRREAHDPVGVWLERVSFVFAVAAGLILIAMALMSVYSILGRWLFSSPLLGDYEMVQMMSAMAVSLTLPYTQWARGHVIVDFFTVKASDTVKRVLDSAAYGLMALLSGVLTWRLAIGFEDYLGNFDASMMLGLPTWWGYVPIVPSFGLLTLVSVYSIYEIIKGYDL